MRRNLVCVSLLMAGIVLLAVLATGCARSDEALVGSWNMDDTILTYRSDHTFEFVSKGDNATHRGTFETRRYGNVLMLTEFCETCASFASMREVDAQGNPVSESDLSDEERDMLAGKNVSYIVIEGDSLRGFLTLEQARKNSDESLAWTATRR